MRFGLEGGKSVILDCVQATTDTPVILKQHAITFDRSADLQRATNNNQVAEQPGDSFPLLLQSASTAYLVISDFAAAFGQNYVVLLPNTQYLTPFPLKNSNSTVCHNL